MFVNNERRGRCSADTRRPQDALWEVSIRDYVINYEPISLNLKLNDAHDPRILY